jgi:hypothetical protein
MAGQEGTPEALVAGVAAKHIFRIEIDRLPWRGYDERVSSGHPRVLSSG